MLRLNVRRVEGRFKERRLKRIELVIPGFSLTYQLFLRIIPMDSKFWSPFRPPTRIPGLSELQFLSTRVSQIPLFQSAPHSADIPRDTFSAAIPKTILRSLVCSQEILCRCTSYPSLFETFPFYKYIYVTESNQPSSDHI